MEATVNGIADGRYESKPTKRVVNEARIRQILEGEPPSPAGSDESSNQSEGAVNDQGTQNNNHK